MILPDSLYRTNTSYTGFLGVSKVHGAHTMLRLGRGEKPSRNDMRSETSSPGHITYIYAKSDIGMVHFSSRAPTSEIKIEALFI